MAPEEALIRTVMKNPANHDIVCAPADGTILIIEDEAGFSELIASTLDEHGFRCHACRDAASAFSWLSGNSPLLIILDYTLPDMNGFDFSMKMREMGMDYQVLMVTGRDDSALAVQMIKGGAFDYLLKDTTFLDRLPVVVNRAIQESEITRKLKYAEASLRQSEARLARAQKIARLGSWEWNLSDNSLYCSEELFRIFGVKAPSSDPLDFSWFYTRINPGDHGTFKKALDSAIDEKSSFNVVCRAQSSVDGEIVLNSLGEVETGPAGEPRIVCGTTLDITARIKAEAEIQKLINYDGLTGLPNRTLLHDRISLAILQAAREKSHVAVMVLDLDRFKGINDTLGHKSGDHLLKTVARRLAACIRETDTLSRLGGDEFVILLNDIQHEEFISGIAGKILTIISEPLIVENQEVFITGSIGIAVYPMDGEESHALLKHADLAMYQAKELDRNNFQFFSREMNVKMIERMMLENSLRRALEREELFLVYQPQIDVRTGETVGLEALLRWNHPDLGLLTPDKFIYLAEDTGLIIPIGEWVIRTACRQAMAWKEQGIGNFRVAVNLSGRQFGQYGLDEVVGAILLETGLPASLLELEITESSIMKNPEESVKTLRLLKQMGLSLAIDDFGTGYSSLAYLKNFPISRLKIDRSFVRDITYNPEDAAIAEIIISMAQMLKLGVTAEGVETREQLEFLSFNNCVEMQGYYFSRPVKPDQIPHFVEKPFKI